MNTYARLPMDMQKAFATNAGMLLSSFDPEAPVSAEEIKRAVLFATIGGVKILCAAKYRDLGADIDNCPKNTKELLEIDSWECRMKGTALTLTEETAEMQFGASDLCTSKKDASLTLIQPRMQMTPADFKTLWYVCSYGTEGGFLAVKMTNALNRGGFSWKAQENQKGEFAFDYVGHSSIDAPNTVPFTFYLKKSGAEKTVNVEAVI